MTPKRKERPMPDQPKHPLHDHLAKITAADNRLEAAHAHAQRMAEQISEARQILRGEIRSIGDEIASPVFTITLDTPGQGTAAHPSNPGAIADLGDGLDAGELEDDLHVEPDDASAEEPTAEPDHAAARVAVVDAMGLAPLFTGSESMPHTAMLTMYLSIRNDDRTHILAHTSKASPIPVSGMATGNETGTFSHASTPAQLRRAMEHHRKRLVDAAIGWITRQGVHVDASDPNDPTIRTLNAATVGDLELCHAIAPRAEREVPPDARTTHINGATHAMFARAARTTRVHAYGWTWRPETRSFVGMLRAELVDGRGDALGPIFAVEEIPLAHISTVSSSDRRDRVHAAAAAAREKLERLARVFTRGNVDTIQTDNALEHDRNTAPVLKWPMWHRWPTYSGAPDEITIPGNSGEGTGHSGAVVIPGNTSSDRSDHEAGTGGQSA